jgi:hypothetical protein
MTRLVRTIFVAVAAIVMLGLPLSAVAQTDRPLTPLERTIHEAFDDNPELGAFGKAGAKPGRILILERLPDGAALVEVELLLEGKRARLPLRLVDARVVWTPTSEFCTALANMLRSGTLPKTRSTRAWADLARLPAFPVIVTGKRAITPFGPIETAGPVEGQDPRNPLKRRTPAGPLPTSQALTQHTNRWIKDVLADDPAPAGFDLIVDASIDWKTFNAALFSVAGAGLYVGEIIADGPNSFTAIPFAAPVGAATGGKPPSLVLAFYPDVDSFGFRVLRNGAPVATADGCEAPMAICGGTPDSYGAALSAVIEGDDVKRAMFASVPTTKTSDGIAFMERTISALNLAPHQLFLGFIAL